MFSELLFRAYCGSVDKERGTEVEKMRYLTSQDRQTGCWYGQKVNKQVYQEMASQSVKHVLVMTVLVLSDRNPNQLMQK